MATMLVASRKGLFVWEGEGTRWRITALHFPGEPVTSVLADPRDGHWYAALRLGHFGVKLHRSADRGRSWTEVAAPAFPPKPTDGPMADDTTPWSVDLVWSMAAGGPDEPGVLWAGCLPAGLFRSDDRGASWALNRPLWDQPGRREWFGGGYDHAGIHSILVDPRDARHVTLGISCGGVWQTRDAGASWSLTAQGMKADYLPAESADDGNTQDPHALPSKCRAILSLMSTAPSGKYALVRPFATVIKSGTTPQFSHANIFPVRPKPAITSSRIRRMPCWSQIFRMPCR